MRPEQCSSSVKELLEAEKRLQEWLVKLQESKLMSIYEKSAYEKVPTGQKGLDLTIFAIWIEHLTCKLRI